MLNSRPKQLLLLIVPILLSVGLRSGGGLRTAYGRDTTEAGRSSNAWNALVDEYFDQGYYRFLPTNGTSDGFHKYDSQLEDFSRAKIQEQIKVLRQFESRIEAVDGSTLGAVGAADREIILSNIRSRLLTLETIRPWEKDPDLYSTGVSVAAYTIMERNFAPANQRLATLIAREKQMPADLAAARENLKDPPRVFTEIALEQLPGTINMFERDLPAAFANASDPTLKSAFDASNKTVIAALKDYQNWLKTDVLARSHGDFRLGADAYSKKLLYDEMVDIPLDRLLQIGMADLRKNQGEFARVAKEVDPSKEPRAVLREMTEDHPSAEQLLPAFRDTFQGLISFIRQKHIVTIPSAVRPVVKETPPFMRATTVASMDSPGPFESGSKQAFFNVTTPAPGDTAEEIKERLEGFNRGTIISTSVHEVYPGHYVQFLWARQAPSKTLKILQANTNVEGWAHYCEQMMLDEGYGQPGYGAKDAKEAALIRLGQLQDALLRDARFIVGIEMHTGKMTFDQGVDFFVQQGYQTREAGMVETKRGTADPTYLYYTLGKLEILKLRADVQKKLGPAFSLQKFHDDFLRQGFPPIKIIRQAMLGDNSPPL